MSANPSAVVAPVASLPRLVTRDETARALSVCLHTIDNMVARGQLKPVRCGRAVRFRESDVLAFINGEQS